MTQNEQNINTASLTEKLLQKAIPFCLYKMPGSHVAEIAVDDGYVSNESDIRFILSPFVPNPDSSAVSFRKIKSREQWKNLSHSLENLPDKLLLWSSLPTEISKAQYISKVKDYVRDIKQGLLSKAILSRVILHSKSADFSPVIAFESLTQKYPETFVSLFYIPHSGVWMGASPELLLEKEASTYRTMALASTQPVNPKGDYHWRAKEQEEHRLVQEHIEQIFRKNDCELVSKNGPYTTESGRVAHLRTDYQFHDRGKQPQAALLFGLHPTPAIGGLPVAASLRCIQKYEGYNRNYYCGYLGETNHRDFTRLYINLRCMQIGSDQIALYVGGGITADSDPEEEWAETIQKSLTMMDVLR